MPQLRKTSSKALAATLQALAHLGGSATEKRIADWTGSSSTTVRNAARILEHCGLVTIGGGAISAVDRIPHSLSMEDALATVSNALSRTDSFIELAALINTGNTGEEAARRAAMVEPTLSDSDSANTMLGVAVDLGLLARPGQGSYAVAETIEAAATQFVAPDTATGSAQLALREIMGSEAYRALERIERDRLGQAIRDIEMDPEKACEDAGKAAENFFRLVAVQGKVDVSGCSGLGQVADTLAGKGVVLIRPQHRVTAHQIAMARNASGHERDKYTLDSWEKTPVFARATVMLSARLIASVHHWREQGRQVL